MTGDHFPHYLRRISGEIDFILTTTSEGELALCKVGSIPSNGKGSNPKLSS